MNIRQLETFYWIDRLGTFHAAAERLNTSQATVSARIRELEAELNLPLFDRIGRRVKVTLKGSELLSHVEKIVTEAARIQLAASRPGMMRGTLKIGLSETVATHHLAAILKSLNGRFAELAVEFHVDASGDLVRKLERGEIDVSIMGGPIHDAELLLEPVGEVQLIWVGAPELLGKYLMVQPADLENFPIISFPREARLFFTMKEWFAVSGAQPSSINYCNNASAMIRVACAGLGICIVPEVLAKPDLHAGRLVSPVSQPPLNTLNMFVATRKDSVDPAIAEIATMVAQVVRMMLSATKVADR